MGPNHVVSQRQVDVERLECDNKKKGGEGNIRRTCVHHQSFCEEEE